MNILPDYFRTNIEGEIRLMREVKIDTKCLETLLDVVEGFVAENGIEAANRYAPCERIERAIDKGRKAVQPSHRQTV